MESGERKIEEKSKETSNDLRRLIDETREQKVLSRENILKDKSYKFALRIVNLYKYLAENKKEFVLSKQILRSGTSVGANIAEASQAQSKLDFVHKLSISLKEASETEYWINLLADSDYLSKDQAVSILTAKNCK